MRAAITADASSTRFVTWKSPERFWNNPTSAGIGTRLLELIRSYKRNLYVNANKADEIVDRFEFTAWLDQQADEQTFGQRHTQ